MDGGVTQIFRQMVSFRGKIVSNTNSVASKHVRRKKNSLRVDKRRSRKTLLKLPNVGFSGASARASGTPYLRAKRKPIDARKFGYDVTVRPYVLSVWG